MTRQHGGQEQCAYAACVPSQQIPPNLGGKGVHGFCATAERTAGFETMEGAQRIGGLWRLYPKNYNDKIVSHNKENRSATPYGATQGQKSLHRQGGRQRWKRGPIYKAGNREHPLLIHKRHHLSISVSTSQYSPYRKKQSR